MGLMLPPEFWDLYMSRIYDPAITTLWPHRQLVDAVMDALDLGDKPRRVLDAGCGTGVYLERIQQDYPKTRMLVGLDRSKPAVKRANSKLKRLEGDRLAMLCDLNQDWPAAGTKFDRVLSVNVLYTVANPQHFLSNAAAQLAPDGQLVLVNPWSTNFIMTIEAAHQHWVEHEATEEDLAHEAEVEWARRLARVSNELIAEVVAGASFHFLSAERLTAMIRETGLTVTHTDKTVYAGTCNLIVATR